MHLFVEGRVQGVFFRATTQKEARRLGLTGWVKNLADGRVEAIVEGPRDQLETLVSWASEGPPAADVTGLDTSWEEATGEFGDFAVRR